MGPAINESQLDTVLDYISIGKDEGAKLVSGGKRLTGKGHDKGWFVAPTVFGDGDRKMRIAHEEIFGAVTVVVPISSLEEAIDISNESEYGLSSAIFTQDINKAFVAMRDLEAGIFYVNLPTIGAETHLPFGGTKQTGNGHREAGLAAPGRLQRVEVDLRRLLRDDPEGADRRAGRRGVREEEEIREEFLRR